jgi:hypothetical protein
MCETCNVVAFGLDTEPGRMWSSPRHASGRRNRDATSIIKPCINAEARTAVRNPLHQDNARLPGKNCDAAKSKYNAQIAREARATAAGLLGRKTYQKGIKIRVAKRTRMLEVYAARTRCSAK